VLTDEAFVCRLPYTLQAVRHADPALCPGRGVLSRVPLGRPPSLHRLRIRSLGCVRRLPCYYGGVRLLRIVHHRLRPKPSRCGPLVRPLAADPEISRLPCKERPCMHGVSDLAGPYRHSLDATARVVFPLVRRGRRPDCRFRGSIPSLHFPYRRFVGCLAAIDARLGADAGRYSFIVVDFHHLLLAGFGRRSSPSHRCAMGPSLSPLKGGEGLSISGRRRV